MVEISNTISIPLVYYYTPNNNIVYYNRLFFYHTFITSIYNKKYLQTMIKSYYLDKSIRFISIKRFYSLNNIYKPILLNKSYGRLSMLFLPTIIKSIISRNLEKNNYKYSIKRINTNTSNNNNYFPIFSFLLVSKKTNRQIIANLFSYKFIYRLFLPL